MLGRRLLALLVAVLCIVARFGLDAGVVAESPAEPAEGVEALAGPGLLCRTSPDAPAEPVGSAPDGRVDSQRTPGSSAHITPCGPWQAPRALGPARERRGDPKASRGPPSSVVS